MSCIKNYYTDSSCNWEWQLSSLGLILFDIFRFEFTTWLLDLNRRSMQYRLLVSDKTRFYSFLFVTLLH